MPNKKAIGVAYADPLLDDITFNNQTNIKFIVLDSAITANSTPALSAGGTLCPAGSIGITSNATGVGHLYMSDGALWQFAKVA
jgi:hypothetical protein